MKTFTFYSAIVALGVWVSFNLTNASICKVSRNVNVCQVDCKEIPDENEFRKIPKDVQYLIIDCLSSNKSGKILDFQIFQKIVFISISRCQVDQMSNFSFHNLPNLHEVYFADLNIRLIPPSMFRNSTNITRLSLIHLPDITEISPYALKDCTNINEINLGGLRLSANIIYPFLLVAFKSIRILTWNNNFKSLDFSSDYFKYFKFRELKLMKNKIDDIEFLYNTHTAEIHLDHNLIGSYFYIEKYRFLLESSSLLSIGSNKICGLFPSVINESKTRIEKLFINNNEITGFDPRFSQIFPKLIYLDASNNKIVKLSDSLQRIQSLIHIIILGNPLFCGCQIKWLLKHKTTSRIVCAKSPFIDQFGNFISLKSPKNLFKISESICTKPKTFLNIYYDNDFYRFRRKNATINLHPCEYIEIKCESKGDPRPEIEMINLNEPAMLKSSFKYEDEVTVSTPRRVISHSMLSKTSKYNDVYCTGTNQYGSEAISLQIYKVDGKRNKRNLWNGVKISDGCYENRSSNSYQNVLLLEIFFFINVYYLFY